MHCVEDGGGGRLVPLKLVGAGPGAMGGREEVLDGSWVLLLLLGLGLLSSMGWVGEAPGVAVVCLPTASSATGGLLQILNGVRAELLLVLLPELCSSCAGGGGVSPGITGA